MRVLMDVIAFLVCLFAVIAVAVGMWAKSYSGLPVRGWFAWHPILMTTAFVFCMPLGRWSYYAGGGDGKIERRVRHRILMVCAVLCMLAGYLCIFMPHWPHKQFFGYNFVTDTWDEWRRVLHVWLGYLLMVLAFAQAAMGWSKMRALSTGHRIFTFHGRLGKTIICLGALNCLVATWFWPKWPESWKFVVTALLCKSAAFGSCVEPEEVSDETSPEEAEDKALEELEAMPIGNAALEPLE